MMERHHFPFSDETNGVNGTGKPSRANGKPPAAKRAKPALKLEEEHLEGHDAAAAGFMGLTPRSQMALSRFPFAQRPKPNLSLDLDGAGGEAAEGVEDWAVGGADPMPGLTPRSTQMMVDAHMGTLGVMSRAEMNPFADDNGDEDFVDKENVSPATQYLAGGGAAEDSAVPHSHCALLLLKPETVQRGLIGEVVRRFEAKVSSSRRCAWSRQIH